jgi:hypothetical protein
MRIPKTRDSISRTGQGGLQSGQRIGRIRRGHSPKGHEVKVQSPRPGAVPNRLDSLAQSLGKTAKGWCFF